MQKNVIIKKKIKQWLMQVLGKVLGEKCLLLYYEFINYRQYLFVLLRTFAVISFWKFIPRQYHIYDIAVIRIDAIGDFFLWLDSALALKKSYPDQQILWIVNVVWKDIAKKILGMEHIIEIDRKKYVLDAQYRYQLLHSLTKIKVKQMLSPCCSRHWELDAICYAITAHKKIGVRGDNINFFGRKKSYTGFFYTQLVRIDPNSQMELLNNAHFTRSIIDPNFKASIVDLTTLLGWQKNVANYFVIFPGASSTQKMWPAEKFATVAQYFASKHKLKVFICGSKEELSITEQILSLLVEVSVEIKTGQTTLEEFMKIILDAQFVVSNDTMAVHIAQVLGTPSFCFISGAHFGRFIPYHTEIHAERNKLIPLFHQMECYGCLWQCKYNRSPVPCIASIEASGTISAINRYFQWD